jgi:uncharacterized membrane protein YdjX (TVP38/TMEM64 family)
MYISILFGAAYGILPGLLLSCLCDSSGSILCYTLSSFLAPPLLELPYYRRMLEKWRKKIMGDPEKGTEAGKDSVFAFLLVLRILPLPPHWVANFVAPHLGIGMGMFWLTCFLGICPVSVIHVMIGSSLDQMTSAEDFKILSPRNIIGMAAVIVAVLIPVGLKRVFKTDFGDLSDQPESAALDTADTADAQAVEFDEHGLPKRTATDAGVTLAGPSQGAPEHEDRARGARSSSMSSTTPTQGVARTSWAYPSLRLRPPRRASSSPSAARAGMARSTSIQQNRGRRRARRGGASAASVSLTVYLHVMF